MIGPETIDQVRNATNLVELVSQSVKLQRRGRSFVGLCPFHQEKTPSFHVNDERGFYHCFGCGQSGDALKFVQETEGLTFIEALRSLAERASITLVETRDASERAQSERARRHQQQLFDLLQATAAYFERCLAEHPLRATAQAELKRRGLDPSVKAVADALGAFRVGYAPFGWDGLGLHLKKLGLNLSDAEALGVVVPRKQGPGYYDRFRHRLMFAILDLQGRVVAFSGRALADPSPAELKRAGHEALPSKQDEPPAKYVNSPESALYRKREVVFGLYQGRQAIRNRQSCVVVEGNFDVVSLHARGIVNVVAPLGTAFTTEQAKQIKRFSPNITLMFDGDSAGKRAVQGAREACKGTQLRVRVAKLPDGTDPDEIAQKHGAEGVERVVASAQGMLEFLIDQTLDAEFSANDLASRAARIREITDLLTSEDDPAVRALAEQHADRIVERLGITDGRTFDALARTVRAALQVGPNKAPQKSEARPESRPAVPSRARSRDRRAEIGLEIFGSLLDYPLLLDDDEVLDKLTALEGDAAAAVATLSRSLPLVELEAFFALLPAPVADFARARAAAPRHEQVALARTELLENLQKLRGFELARLGVEAIQELERVQGVGDFDQELRLLEEQAGRARARLGL